MQENETKTVMVGMGGWELHNMENRYEIKPLLQAFLAFYIFSLL